MKKILLLMAMLLISGHAVFGMEAEDERAAKCERGRKEERLFKSIMMLNKETALACLEEDGITIHARDQYDSTPLHCAAEEGMLDLAQDLLARDPSQMDAEDDFGYTPLYAAANRNQLEVVRYLFDKTVPSDQRVKKAREILPAATGCETKRFLLNEINKKAITAVLSLQKASEMVGVNFPNVLVREILGHVYGRDLSKRSDTTSRK